MEEIEYDPEKELSLEECIRLFKTLKRDNQIKLIEELKRREKKEVIKR